jgi:hypothetical protein
MAYDMVYFEMNLELLAVTLQRGGFLWREREDEGAKLT